MPSPFVISSLLRRLTGDSSSVISWFGYEFTCERQVPSCFYEGDGTCGSSFLLLFFSTVLDGNRLFWLPLVFPSDGVAQWLRCIVSHLGRSTCVGSNPVIGTTNRKATGNSTFYPSKVGK